MPAAGDTTAPADREACIRCKIGEVSVSLCSDLKQMLDDFACIYPPERSDSAPDQIIHIEVRKSGRSRIGRSLYRVYADGQEIGGRCHRNAVFPFVEWGINLRVIARRSEYLQLHAASMAYCGRGFIFAGDSGCGKSTLAAMLLARGWQYLCDELALVHVGNMLLQPFPKALCIKAGSFPIVRRLALPFVRRRDFIKAFKGRVGYINPRDFGPHTIAEPTPSRFVVFPTYQNGTNPRLHSISRAEAAIKLFRLCFNRRTVGDQTLEILTTLVRRCDCFRLDVAGPDETVRLLEAHFGQAATSAVTEPVAQQVAPAGPRPERQRVDLLASRREVLLGMGAKLAYVVPAVVTLTAQQAFATTSLPSGMCSTALHTGSLCETDTDCCSAKCTLGVCK